jgi:hypothetical protein
MTNDFDHERVRGLLEAYARAAFADSVGSTGPSGAEMSSADRRVIELHLESCAECRLELEGLRAVTTLRGDARLTADERDVLHRSLNDVRARTHPRPVALPATGQRGPRLYRSLTAVAAVLVLIVGAVVVAQLGSGGSSGDGASGPGGESRAEGSGRHTLAEPGTAAESSGPSPAGGAGDVSQSPKREPIFDSSVGRADEGELRATAESDSFRSLASAQGPDPQARREELLQELADQAPDSTAADQVLTCGGRTLEEEPDAIPVYARSVKVDDDDAIALGYAESQEPDGPLDRYLVIVNEEGSCEEVERVQGDLGD